MQINTLSLLIGSIFIMLSIVLGAFGAHGLKKILSPEKVASFEVGVRYQMYSGIALLIFGYTLNFIKISEIWIIILITLGTILFSGSIYLLSMAEFWEKKFKFLGPLTPIGGLLMIIAWVVFLISIL